MTGAGFERWGSQPLRSRAGNSVDCQVFASGRAPAGVAERVRAEHEHEESVRVPDGVAGDLAAGFSNT